MENPTPVDMMIQTAHHQTHSPLLLNPTSSLHTLLSSTFSYVYTLSHDYQEPLQPTDPPSFHIIIVFDH